MEVNLDNAFLVLLKLTLGFFTKYVDDVTETMTKQCHNKIRWLLRKPLFTTVLLTCLLLLIFGLMTYSILLVFAVACVVTIIILFEGLILGFIFIMAWSTAVTCMGLCIIIFAISTTYTTKQYKEEE